MINSLLSYPLYNLSLTSIETYKFINEPPNEARFTGIWYFQRVYKKYLKGLIG